MRQFLSSSLVVATLLCAPAAAKDSPEQRAASFLAVEVPQWQTENRCYSCHNNGDAARGLMLARRAGLIRDDAPLADTLAFLRRPEQWDANGPDGPFKDQQLARIQFAAALAQACEADLIEDREALESAASLVAELQEKDGSWPADAPGTVGSPVTYGKSLATAMALRTLESASGTEPTESLERGRKWFETHAPKNVLDAAAALLALAAVDTTQARTQRERALAVLRQGQADAGGWGPFVRSPPEVFDTAAVLIALAVQPDREAHARLIDGGRRFLLARQLADGSWPATTRPPGVDSYAQRLSTTGWALQALLATGHDEVR